MMSSERPSPVGEEVAPCMAREHLRTAEKAVRPLQVYVAASGSGQLPAKNAYLFLSFPYIGPEPVLVKRSFLVQNGIAKDMRSSFAPGSTRYLASGTSR